MKLIGVMTPFHFWISFSHIYFPFLAVETMHEWKREVGATFPTNENAI